MNRFRIIRGERAKYRTHSYATLAARDAAASRYASQDGESVMTELWSQDHPQDPLNDGWALDGVVDPPGHVHVPEPGDPDVTRPHDRTSASRVDVGDDVTVWAFEHNTQLPAGWVSGTVTNLSEVGARGSEAILLIGFSDGTARRVISSAVSYVWDHDAPPIAVRDRDKVLDF